MRASRGTGIRRSRCPWASADSSARLSCVFWFGGLSFRGSALLAQVDALSSPADCGCCASSSIPVSPPTMPSIVPPSRPKTPYPLSFGAVSASTHPRLLRGDRFVASVKSQTLQQPSFSKFHAASNTGTIQSHSAQHPHSPRLQYPSSAALLRFPKSKKSGIRR